MTVVYYIKIAENLGGVKPLPAPTKFRQWSYLRYGGRNVSQNKNYEFQLKYVEK